MAKKSKSVFSNNLARLRERVGLSQSVVAGKLGLTQPSYSNLESGKSRLTVDRAKKLTQIMGCQMWELSDDFLAEPLVSGRGRGENNAGARQFQEPMRSEGDPDVGGVQTGKMIATAAAFDPVLRIMMEQTGKSRNQYTSDLHLLVYAAASKHINDFEHQQNKVASDDYIRGVVAAKLDQFRRRPKA